MVLVDVDLRSSVVDSLVSLRSASISIDWTLQDYLSSLR